MNKRNNAFFVFLSSLLLLASCVGLPPTQEMSDARQALQAADDVAAAQLMSERMNHVKDLVRDAERNLSMRRYEQARESAVTAKNEANTLRNVTWAIRQARSAMDQLPGELAELKKRLEPKLDAAIDAARAGRDDEAIATCAQIRQAIATVSDAK
ncbi:MAG: DUF4398 domain-containing protein [Gammaproteobacteria bacterium]|nr:DUF4398 domain-containing protein [Gammaproteobacteria bacterium]